MAPGERRRGPARNIVWVSVETGAVRLMRARAALSARWPADTADLRHVDRGRRAGAAASSAADVPGGGDLWDALDQFHLSAVAGIRDQLASTADREAQRLVLPHGARSASQTFELFDRLSAVVVRRADHGQSGADPADPLLAACQIVAETHPYTDRPPVGTKAGPADVRRRRRDRPRVAAARAADAAARRLVDAATSGRWWPGTARSATRWRSCRSGRRYVMIEPEIRHAPRRRPGGCDGARPGGGDVLSDPAVARASDSATCSPSRSATRAATTRASPWRSSCSACCRW